MFVSQLLFHFYGVILRRNAGDTAHSLLSRWICVSCVWLKEKISVCEVLFPLVPCGQQDIQGFWDLLCRIYFLGTSVLKQVWLQQLKEMSLVTTLQFLSCFIKQQKNKLCEYFQLVSDSCCMVKQSTEQSLGCLAGALVGWRTLGLPPVSQSYYPNFFLSFFLFNLVGFSVANVLVNVAAARETNTSKVKIDCGKQIRAARDGAFCQLFSWWRATEQHRYDRVTRHPLWPKRCRGLVVNSTGTDPVPSRS